MPTFLSGRKWGFITYYFGVSLTGYVALFFWSQNLATDRWLEYAIFILLIAIADLVHVTYLAADLLRRRGRVREAVPLYSLVATAEDAPQQLRELALFLATRLMEGIEGEDAGQPSDD